MSRTRLSHASLTAMLRRPTPEQRVLQCLKEMSPPDHVHANVTVQDAGPFRVATSADGRPLDMITQLFVNLDNIQNAVGHALGQYLAEGNIVGGGNAT
jgi:hypothetical protein